MPEANGSNLPVERKLLLFENISASGDAVFNQDVILLVEPSVTNPGQPLGRR